MSAIGCGAWDCRKRSGDEAPLDVRSGLEQETACVAAPDVVKGHSDPLDQSSSVHAIDLLPTFVLRLAGFGPAED